jgi:hypothetical protein
MISNGAFASAVSNVRPQALIVLPAPLMSTHAGQIAAVALEHRLPLQPRMVAESRWSHKRTLLATPTNNNKAQ